MKTERWWEKPLDQMTARALLTLLEAGKGAQSADQITKGDSANRNAGRVKVQGGL